MDYKYIKDIANAGVVISILYTALCEDGEAVTLSYNGHQYGMTPEMREAIKQILLLESKRVNSKLENAICKED